MWLLQENSVSWKLDVDQTAAITHIYNVNHVKDITKLYECMHMHIAHIALHYTLRMRVYACLSPFLIPDTIQCLFYRAIEFQHKKQQQNIHVENMPSDRVYKIIIIMTCSAKSRWFISHSLSRFFFLFSLYCVSTCVFNIILFDTHVWKRARTPIRLCLSFFSIFA